MATSTFNAKYDYVYNYLFCYYRKLAMETCEYLTTDMVKIIDMTTHNECVQMAQKGLLEDFYSRLIRGQIW